MQPNLPCWPELYCHWDDTDSWYAHSPQSFHSLQKRHAGHIFQRRCFRAGALCAGIAHYAGTAKGLTEEGIDPAARLRAFPIAVRPPEPDLNMHVHLMSASVKPTAGWHSQGAIKAIYAGLRQIHCSCSRMRHTMPCACR